jgi:hypothetical protein
LPEHRQPPPICEARPAAWKASPITYTPPWKYRTTWRGSIPSTVISAVGTPPGAAAVTVTAAGRRTDAGSRRGSLPVRCSRTISLRPGWLGSAPRRARACRTTAEIRAGRRAATTLAARQVRKRHQITVIHRTRPGGTESLNGRDPAARRLDQEQEALRASGPGASALVTRTATSRQPPAQTLSFRSQLSLPRVLPGLHRPAEPRVRAPFDSTCAGLLGEERRQDCATDAWGSGVDIRAGL